MIFKRLLKCLLPGLILLGIWGGTSYGQGEGTGYKIRKPKPLSPDSARKLSQLLLEKKILSPLGKARLDSSIAAGKFKKTMERQHYAFGIRRNRRQVITSRGLYPSELLFFLADCFTGDFYYRYWKGTSAENRSLDWDIDRRSVGTPVEKDSLKKHPECEGHHIEAAIPGREPVPEDLLYHRDDWTGYYRFWKSHGMFKGVNRQTSVLGRSRLFVINTLKEIGLIEERVYAQAMEHIENWRLIFEREILYYLAVRTAVYENFRKNMRHDEPLLNRLMKTGLMTQSGYERLMQDFQKIEIRPPFGFIPYCQYGWQFTLSDFDPDPEKGYAQLMDSLKQFIPGFNYTDFRLKRIQPKGIYYRMTFRVDGKLFRHKFHHYPLALNGLEMTDIRLFSTNHSFVGGINKWLKKEHAPYRLYHANHADISFSAVPQEGFLLMNRSQYHAWKVRNDQHFIYDIKDQRLAGKPARK